MSVIGDMEHTEDQNQEEIEEVLRKSGREDMRDKKDKKDDETAVGIAIGKNDEKNKGTGKDDENEEDKTKRKKEETSNKDKEKDQKTPKNWPCIKCNKDASDHSLKCTVCNGWIHIDECAELADETMKPPFDKDKYKCPNCKESKESKKRPLEKQSRPSIQTILMRGDRKITRCRRRNEGNEIQEKVKSPTKKKLKVGEVNRKNVEEKKARKEETNPNNDNDNKNKKAKTNDNKIGNAGQYISLLSCRESNLFKEDYESMNDKKYITDGGIQFYIQSLWERIEDDMKDKKVKIVSPSISHYIQSHDSKKAIRNMINDMEFNDSEWIIYPINNKVDVEKDGGTHWSLLVYRKIDNTYLHYDPIEGVNEIHAKRLIANLIDIDSFDEEGNMPKKEEVVWERQKGGYDCGVFTMMYATTVLENIKEGRMVEDNSHIRYKSDELRMLLRTAIKTEILRGKNQGDKQNITHIMDKLKLQGMKIDGNKGQIDKSGKCEKGKQDDKHKQDEEKTKVANGTNEKGNKDGNKERITCKYFLTSKCRFGTKCRNFHPEICKNWAKIGFCDNINRNPQCKMPHPPKCNGNACRGQQNCRYVHPAYVRKIKQNIPPIDKPQNQNQTFNVNQHDDYFLDWPLPKEASMNIRQLMAKMNQRMNEWEARWERMERNRMNRWVY